MSLFAQGHLPMHVHALRLSPGDDLRQALMAHASARKIKAGFILAAVGSLSEAQMRFAGQTSAAALIGDLEIVALSGTIAEGGAVHLHLAVANAAGEVRGGHMLAGCKVRTTAEIILGHATDLHFTRSRDPLTGYFELVPAPRVP